MTKVYQARNPHNTLQVRIRTDIIDLFSEKYGHREYNLRMNEILMKFAKDEFIEKKEFYNAIEDYKTKTNPRNCTVIRTKI